MIERTGWVHTPRYGWSGTLASRLWIGIALQHCTSCITIIVHISERKHEKETTREDMIQMCGGYDCESVFSFFCFGVYVIMPIYHERISFPLIRVVEKKQGKTSPPTPRSPRIPRRADSPYVGQSRQEPRAVYVCAECGRVSSAVNAKC